MVEVCTPNRICVMVASINHKRVVRVRGIAVKWVVRIARNIVRA